MGNTEFYDENRANLRSSLLGSLPNSGDFNELFFRTIQQYFEGSRLLDVGTGNGYVISELLKRKLLPVISPWGIDFSQNMIDKARKNLGGNASLVLGDNFDLPFAENSFDIVTAKNVTRISFEEIFKVLKEEGYFVFREYGPKRGMGGVVDLFPERIIRPRDLSFYVEAIAAAGLEIVSKQAYEFRREYRKADVLKLVEAFPLVEGYSPEDRKLLENRLDPSVSIVSDPLLIVARRTR